jgi:hypothetical protein
VTKKHLSVEQHLNAHSPCEPETVHLNPAPRGGIQARMPVRARMVAVGVQLPLVPERVGPQHEAQRLARLVAERERSEGLDAGRLEGHRGCVGEVGVYIQFIRRGLKAVSNPARIVSYTLAPSMIFWCITLSAPVANVMINASTTLIRNFQVVALAHLKRQAAQDLVFLIKKC